MIGEERKRALRNAGLGNLAEADAKYFSSSAIQKGIETVRRATFESTADNIVLRIFETISAASLGKFRQFGRFQKGGLVGGLMQILSRSEQKVLPEATELLQKGFDVNTWLKNIRAGGASVPLGNLKTQTIQADKMKLYIDALRKKQTGLSHDTTLMRGTSIDMDRYNSLNPGDIFEIPGTSSFTTQLGTAQTFAGMHRIGAEK